MRIAIKTLGCKLNQAEGEKILKQLAERGFSVTNFKNKADIYIVNACTVTATADRKVQLIINNFKNKNPKAKIILTGCFSKKPRGIDLVLKNKNNLVDKLAKNYHLLPEFKKDKKEKALGKIRAFIKIQDGCDNFCSYCIIPLMRGLPRSFKPDEIVGEINEKRARGFKEIVLTGVNICKYRFNNLDLVGLVLKILKETKIERIRFGSIDPSLVTDKFIGLFKEKRICNHLHLSLQSGSDSVLKRMNRKYTSEEFLELVEKIKRRYPLFGFTTDVIVGFPGETEEDFNETCDFIKRVGFHKIHIFPFSRRPGTVADKLNFQVDLKTKKARVARIKEISKKLSKEFNKKIKGKKFEVLFENKLNGQFIGFTDNYVKVKKKGNNFKINKVIKVRY